MANKFEGIFKDWEFGGTYLKGPNGEKVIVPPLFEDCPTGSCRFVDGFDGEDREELLREYKSEVQRRAVDNYVKPKSDKITDTQTDNKILPKNWLIIVSIFFASITLIGSVILFLLYF